jgi:branched-chain amino acid transport system permease protein
VPAKTYKVKVFVLSAVYASLAGSLYAHYLTFISPKTFDIFFSIELVTMVILGGMGSIWGVLFGTIFLTSLPNVLHFFDEYKDIVYGLILVLILILMPEGVGVGLRERWQARRKPKELTKYFVEPVERLGDGVCWTKEDKRAVRTGARFPKIASQSILKVDNVSLSFGGLFALDQVSFDMPEGAVTALIGPNGAGKTTMINVISGVYRPHRGSILLGTRQVQGLSPYKMAELGVTRTFQNIQLFDNMNILENAMVGMHSRTRNEFLYSVFHLPGFTQEEKKIEQRAWEMLSFVSLESRAELPAHSLSFGDKKRLEMARALASGPRVVLLDEPVAGLNMTESLEIAKLIDKIRAQGISVLLVEHDMNVVMKISDKVVVFNFGTKIAEDSPQEIQRNAQVLSAYLGGVPHAQN